MTGVAFAAAVTVVSAAEVVSKTGSRAECVDCRFSSKLVPTTAVSMMKIVGFILGLMWQVSALPFACNSDCVDWGWQEEVSTLI